MSIFDNLDLSAVGSSGGLNPFAFLSQGQQQPQAAAPPEPEPPPPSPISAGPAVAGLAGTALGGPAPLDLPDAPKQGLLARIMAPSPDGLTFQDKLFAAGGILKGDSDGASKYLTGRRTELA